MNTIKKILNKINENNISAYASQCAYFSFLSFIPFIILLLSLVKYINIDKETFEYILEAVLPVMAKNGILNIIQEVYSKSIRDNFFICSFFIMVCRK